MNYYISDLHFGHKNILSYDNRKYLNIEEHDEALINNWNEQVGYYDDVYILGDISWHNVTKTVDILKRLNGNLHLIVGNHDHNFLKNKDLRECFTTINLYLEIKDNGRDVVLCHYPIPCFNRHYYGAYHLFGHTHLSFENNMMENIKRQMTELYNTPCNMYNVGCMIDYMNYTPRTLEEIVEGNK